VTPTAPLRTGLGFGAAAVGLAFAGWLAFGMTRLPPSPDWLGNLSVFLHHDFFSAEILGSAHYNRFPLNAAILYIAFTLLHGHAWVLHLLMAAWVAGFLLAWGRGLRRLAGDPTCAILAGCLLLGHPSFFRTLTDLSCTHYLAALFFVVLALNGILRGDAPWKAVLYGCIGTLFSEVTLLCVPMLVALQSGREHRFLSTRSLWLAAPVGFYLAVRGLAFAVGDSGAARWRAYTLDPIAIPGNALEVLRVFLPTRLGPPAIWDVPFFWIGVGTALLGIVLLWILARRAGDPARPLPVHPAWPPLSIAATLPFVALEPQSPRLYLTFVFVGLTWLAWVWPRLPRSWVAPALCIWLATNSVTFTANLTQHVEAGAFWRFFTSALAEQIERHPDTDSWLLFYGQAKSTRLEVAWGLPLALGDPEVRETFVPGSARHATMIALFPGTSHVCSDRPAPSRSVAFVARGVPDSLPPIRWCDEKCRSCQPPTWNDVLTQPFGTRQ
jgi:hypothetical protein